VLRDETAARLAEEHRVLLLHELNHRIKNTLATVQSIAEQTLRAAEVPAEARRVLTERLIALSQAHDVLVDQSWAGADLEAIVRGALAPHERTARKAFDIDGPPVRLSPPQAVSMALALHELATNAAKHGALRAAEGRVTVTWNLALDGRGARRLNLLWRESGGPRVTPPTRRGFGARLISRTFGNESGGHAKLDYAPEGVRCVLQLPLSQAEELPILGPPERA
jgi:two-component sensor histidine kinase